MNPVYSVGHSNLVSAAKLTILVIESKSCLLDSLSQDISGLSDVAIVKARADALPSSSEYPLFNVVLYSIDSNHCESVESDIATLANRFSEASIVLLSDGPPVSMMKLIESGDIAGIVPNSYSTNQLVNCLRLINSGVIFVPNEFSRREQNPAVGITDEQLALTKKLTPRQREVLKYVSLGKSNKFIAAELSLCESTVKVHVHEVMKRLGATSRTHASYIANNVHHADSATESEAALV